MSTKKIYDSPSRASTATTDTSRTFCKKFVGGGHTVLSGNWNDTIQTPHGGQEWRDMNNFIEDFSVTTNPLGPPVDAMQAAVKSMATVEHYPAADFEPALTDVADFLRIDKPRLILGNGASELIDIIIRMSPKCKDNKWKPGPFLTQYQEYRRSATNAGYSEANFTDRDVQLTCLVNPCNPTGDYLDMCTMRQYVEDNCQAGSWVVVDESMQPWIGPDWRTDSLISQCEWVSRMLEKGVAVFVIHSWTKLFACPGMRLGSVVCPSDTIAMSIRKIQVPWSVNSMGLAFLSACCRDQEYLEKTWEVHRKWRAYTVGKIVDLAPSWTIYGEPWSSWIWIDTHCSKVAENCTRVCKDKGVPIRWGLLGYKLPTYIRIGVRSPIHVEHLVSALKHACYHED